MIFGSKSDFAIEAMTEPDLVAPSHIWGRICIWIQGVPLGDISDIHCTLYGSYDLFREMDDSLDTRWNSDFSEMTDAAIYDYLDFRLYGVRDGKELQDDRTIAQMENDWSRLVKFNFLTNWSESFDQSDKYFLIRTPDGTTKIISLDVKLNEHITLQCSEFSFRKAARNFCSWFEEERVRLQSEHA